MSRLESMSRFEEHPALPEPPFFDFEDYDLAIRRPRREHRIVDTPEQVRACLSCPKPRCTNCLGPSGLRWSELKLRARRKKAQVPGLDRQARDA